MYNTGVSGFLAAASNPNREVATRITLKMPQGNVVLTSNDIVSYKIIGASMAGKHYVPGCFVATTLEVSLNASSQEVSKIDFKTAVINSLTVEAGIKAGTMVYIPMGVFYVDVDGISAENNGLITVKASNLPPVMSNVFSSESFSLPCTVQEALNALSNSIGIPIHVSVDLFPNLSIMLTETFTLSATNRETLRYMAEALGAYACMGRDGEVYLEKMFKGVAYIGCTLDGNYLFTLDQKEGAVTPFQRISIKANAEDVGVSYEIPGITTGKEYNIYNNPFTYGHPEDFLEGLVQPVTFTEFHPAKISFHGRPDIDTGDVLQYVHKGVTYLLPVCIHTFEYNGGFKTTIEGIGTDSSAVSSDSPTKVAIEAIKQNINSLVRDLSQTQSHILSIDGDIVRMSSILQTVEQLQLQVSKIEEGVSSITTLSQTAEQLRIDISTLVQDLSNTNAEVSKNQAALLTYFDFQADGLTIGLSSSPIKLRMSNNKIQFLRDEDEVAYLSEGQLYVTNAHFIKTLVLGNFEFTPRTNGNLSLRRR